MCCGSRLVWKRVPKHVDQSVKVADTAGLATDAENSGGAIILYNSDIMAAVRACLPLTALSCLAGACLAKAQTTQHSLGDTGTTIGVMELCDAQLHAIAQL